MTRFLRVLGVSCGLVLLALAPVACGDSSGDSSGETTATTGSTGASSTGAASTTEGTGGTDAGTDTGSGTDTDTDTGGACADQYGHYDPWLEPLGPSDEPCEASDYVEACMTADDLAGYRQCLAFEIVEDMTELSWGACMQTCDPEAYTVRACGGDDEGLSFCDELTLQGENVHVWFPCLDQACLLCAPGDTKLCGPDTPYPETTITCGLNGAGVPVWHDGDCYT